MTKTILETLPESQITKQQIARYLPSHPIIIEAGAHIGRDTSKLAQLWPQGHIYAFEPVPELFEQLQKNTAQYSNITCFNSALSDTNGAASLYISSGRSTACSSLLEPKDILTLQPDILFNRELIIQTITLDTWSLNSKIISIDFIWFDMQGCELKALQGAQQLLSTIKAIFLEVNLRERYKNSPTFDDIANYLEQYSFKPVQKDTPKHDKINILFVRS